MPPHSLPPVRTFVAPMETPTHVRTNHQAAARALMHANYAALDEAQDISASS
jgi:hypothetical protein